MTWARTTVPLQDLSFPYSKPWVFLFDGSSSCGQNKTLNYKENWDESCLWYFLEITCFNVTQLDINTIICRVDEEKLFRNFFISSVLHIQMHIHHPHTQTHTHTHIETLTHTHTHTKNITSRSEYWVSSEEYHQHIYIWQLFISYISNGMDGILCLWCLSLCVVLFALLSN